MNFTFKSSLYLSSLIFFFLFTVITLSSGCVQLPNKADISEGLPLPIDGVWKESGAFKSLVTNYRIERGRIYLVDGVGQIILKPGSVIIKDIRRQHGNLYSLNYLTTNLSGDSYTSHVGSLEVVGSDKLIIRYASGAPLGLTEVKLTKVSLDDEQAFYTAHIQQFNISVVNMHEESVEADFENQQVDPGAKLTIERERTIVHGVTLQETQNEKITTHESSSALELDFVQLFGGEIKKDISSEIQKSMNHTFQTQESFKATIELDGNVSSYWELIWYDRIKKGIAKCIDNNGNVHYIPFEFPISSEIKAIGIQKK